MSKHAEAADVLRRYLPQKEFEKLERFVELGLDAHQFVARALTRAVGLLSPEPTTDIAAPVFEISATYADVLPVVLTVLYVARTSEPASEDRRRGVAAVVVQSTDFRVSKLVAILVRGRDKAAEDRIRETSGRGTAYLNQLVAIAVSCLKGQTTRSAATAKSRYPFILSSVSSSDYGGPALGLLTNFDEEAGRYLASLRDYPRLWERLRDCKHVAKTADEVIAIIRKALLGKGTKPPL